MACLRTCPIFALALSLLGFAGGPLCAAPEPPPADDPGEVYVLSPGFAQEDVSDWARVLPDPAGALTFEQVRSPAMAARFSVSRPVAPGVEATWIRLRVENRSGVSRYVLWVYPYMAFECYDVEADGKVVKLRNGLDVPIQDKAYRYDSAYVEVNWPPGKVKTIYVRTITGDHSRYNSQIIVRLIAQPLVLQANYRDTVKLAFILGIMGIMGVYNLALFLFTRDRAYLYYALSIFATAVYLLISDCPPIKTLFVNLWSLQILLASAALMAFVNFSRHFLDAPTRFPPWNRVLQGAMALLGAISTYSALKAWFPRLPFLVGLINFSFIPIFFLLLAFACHAYRRRFRPALYYLQTSAVFLLFITFWVISPRFLGWLDLGLFSTYSFRVGILLQVFLFSIALAARINLLRKEVEGKRREKEELELRRAQEIQRLTEQKYLELEQKVAERTAAVNRQKQEIERKNAQITASIGYASRIQAGVLPPVQEVAEAFADQFVLLKPKAIVSGDFYWLKAAGGRRLAAVADCTGHGVPGALMSMLGVALLNETVREDHVPPAGEILDCLNRRVKKALHQTIHSDATRDGLSIGLAIYAEGLRELQFAGAYHPLYRVREGALQQWKGDLMPVGFSRKVRSSFTTHPVDLRPGDALYLATDGFADQFGGPFGEKYSRRRFRQLLLDIHAEPMARQKVLLEEALETWRAGGGGFEQIDDVLVMGLRI